MKFGEFFKSKRSALYPSMRNFCAKFGYDSGNISKLERGVISPPQSRAILDEYAKHLRIEKNSRDYKQMIKLAKEESVAFQLGFIFKITDAKVKARLPNFVRVVQQKRLTPEGIDRMIHSLTSMT